MRYIIIILMVLGVLFIASCSSILDSTSGGSTVETSSTENLEEVTLEIEGMFCSSCSLGVESQLKEVEGVIDAKVDISKGKGYVTYDSSLIDPESIAKASTVYVAKVIENHE